MSSELTKPEQTAIPKTVKGWLASDYFKTQVALCLPKHLTADRFVRVALTALTRIPKLAECTPESVIRCMMACSELGIEPDGRRAHLIPFENRKFNRVECQLIIDYKGLCELANRSGAVSNIHADIVCENDDFEFNRGELKKHIVNYRKPRGEMYAAYALIRFKDGGEKCEVMTKEEIDSIRKRSRAAQSGPWVTDYNEMAKKTAFRRASKWITLSPEIADALERDDDKPSNVSSLVAETPLELPASDSGSAIETEAEVVPEPSKDAPVVNTAVKTQQAELSELVVGSGFSFNHFQKWGEGTGNVPDATSLGSFDEIPNEICKRLLRAKVGLLKGLEAIKSGAA